MNSFGKVARRLSDLLPLGVGVQSALHTPGVETASSVPSHSHMLPPRFSTPTDGMPTNTAGIRRGVTG